MNEVRKIQEPVIHGGRLLQIFCFQGNNVSNVLETPDTEASGKFNKACNQKEELGSLFLNVSSFTYRHLNQLVRIFLLFNVTVYCRF
jgi:hypothetical protein